MLGIRSRHKVHFIGIGGIGMSGIAEVLLNLGHLVSGSDLVNGETTKKLKKLGAHIYIGHDKAHIEEGSVVVYSSAIDPENPEYRECRAFERAYMSQTRLTDLERSRTGRWDPLLL